MNSTAATRRDACNLYGHLASQSSASASARCVRCGTVFDRSEGRKFSRAAGCTWPDCHCEDTSICILPVPLNQEAAASR